MLNKVHQLERELINVFINIIIIIIILLMFIKVGMLGWERIDALVSVQRPQPQKTNQYKKERERECSGRRTRKRVAQDNEEAFTLLLKSYIHALSDMMSKQDSSIEMLSDV